MKQYQDIKTGYPDTILFFRLGDFYEMFSDDAVKASPILGVVLTKRQSVPMCGIPHHSANSYIKKLILSGLKVAVCEQLENPKDTKGIVKRGVTRVITPGTILEENLLDSDKNNYLVSIYPGQNYSNFGLSYVDISTGEFAVTELSGKKLLEELYRISPVEIVIPESERSSDFFKYIAEKTSIPQSTLDDYSYNLFEAQTKIKSTFGIVSLKSFSIEDNPLCISSAAGIITYIQNTQKESSTLLKNIRFYSLKDYMSFDDTAVKNLELIEGLNSRTKENSLIEVIDETLTSMGARLLRKWILRPLLKADLIRLRQEAVSFLAEEGISRKEIRSNLKEISDIERILSRLSSLMIRPRELLSLKLSLEILPKIKNSLTSEGKLIEVPEPLKNIKENLDYPVKITELVSNAIKDEPSNNVKDSNVIREGYNSELDELKNTKKHAKKLISDIEAKEKERTGINSLKIGYTSVFGYYIEITKSNLHLAPKEYIRKQTLTNAERFITQELKVLEEKILYAEEKILRLEETLFNEVRFEILKYSNEIQLVCGAISELDVYASLAETAVNRSYSRPLVNEDFDFEIKDGRHPVIENKLKTNSFVPNDTFLNGSDDQIILLTGPNMSGKSTYLRQIALIAVLAQAGSFVPASYAKIGIIDCIFTRIGAADNLAQGESTFMVEMHETSNILNRFTNKSLIILDEVGRGTSTYDGISIAWACLEYLSNSKVNGFGPKVLFATHYFELTGLAKTHNGIKNFNVSVKEWKNDVIFMHKIIPGPADRSYGIHVAKLAGLPKEVVARAWEILDTLETKSEELKNSPASNQLDLFKNPVNANKSLIFSKILIELEQVELDSITPLEALKLLSGLKSKIKAEREKNVSGKKEV